MIRKIVHIPIFLMLLLVGLSSCSIDILSVDMPDQAIAGSTIPIKITIQNISTEKTTELIAFGLSIDPNAEFTDQELGKLEVKLQGGETKTVHTNIRIPHTVVKGNYYLVIVSGRDDYAQPISIQGPISYGVDIQPANFSWSTKDATHILQSKKLVLGQLSQFNFSTLNHTNQAAKGVIARYYLSKNSVLNKEEDLQVGGSIYRYDVPGHGQKEHTGTIFLDPNAFPKDQAALNKFSYLLVSIDDDNAIAEYNEHNLLAKSISIRKEEAINSEAATSRFSPSNQVLETSKKEDLQLSIFPNPSVNGKVNIALKMQQVSDVEIEIHALNGSLLQSFIFKDQAQLYEPLNLDFLESGYYLLSAKTANHPPLSQPIIIH